MAGRHRIRAVAGFLMANFVLCIVCSAASIVVGPLGTVVLPLPVAACFVRGRVGLGVCICGLAALAAFLTLGGVQTALLYALVAGIGIPLGVGIAHGWRYRRIVALVAVTGYALILGAVLASWNEWCAAMQSQWGAFASSAQSNAASDSDVAAQIVAMSRWAQEHVPEMMLGTMFWPLLIGACVLVAVAIRWFGTKYRVPAPPGSIRDMKPPDWLVWLVIACAGLWYADARWHVAAARLVAWNGAIALAAVYWLNGLSVALYVLNAVRAQLFVYAALGILLMLGTVHPLLCFTGLFDTWGDFRTAADRALAAWRKRNEDREDDDE